MKDTLMESLGYRERRIKLVNENKQNRTGVLRISRAFLSEIFTNFLIGRSRFINKNLKLMNLKHVDDPPLDNYYELLFTADDLPIVIGGFKARHLSIAEVEGRKNCYKLVEE